MSGDKYEEINFPVFGQYVVAIDGHVTKAGEEITFNELTIKARIDNGDYKAVE